MRVEGESHVTKLRHVHSFQPCRPPVGPIIFSYFCIIFNNRCECQKSFRGFVSPGKLKPKSDLSLLSSSSTTAHVTAVSGSRRVSLGSPRSFYCCSHPVAHSQCMQCVLTGPAGVLTRLSPTQSKQICSVVPECLCL